MKQNTEWIKLDNNTYIHPTAIIYDNVVIGANCVIGEYTIIGRNNLDLLFNENTDAKQTVIGDNCYIDAYTFISMGAKIGTNVTLGPNTFIGRYTKIGNGTKCHYHAQIYENVVIGANCKIGGFCCNDVVVGDNSNVYGKLIHKFNMRNDPRKKPPMIGSNVTIGVDSVIIDGIVIGDGSYIASNSIITRDVEPSSRVKNVNEIF